MGRTKTFTFVYSRFYGGEGGFIVGASVMWAGEPFDIEQELEVSNRGRAYI